ncbi:hypothetical protein C1H46_044244 [Malus baccata]|uniref:Uncharacterized protein n=1 Tax=Malus baccata TaxID=106549 RepID=A0A540K8H8_MALBA|nr:hypothetical protein C1H46_044244 [Malus baccata]
MHIIREPIWIHQPINGGGGLRFLVTPTGSRGPHGKVDGDSEGYVHIGVGSGPEALLRPTSRYPSSSTAKPQCKP